MTIIEKIALGLIITGALVYLVHRLRMSLKGPVCTCEGDKDCPYTRAQDARECPFPEQEARSGDQWPR